MTYQRQLRFDEPLPGPSGPWQVWGPLKCPHCEEEAKDEPEDIRGYASMGNWYRSGRLWPTCCVNCGREIEVSGMDEYVDKVNRHDFPQVLLRRGGL